MDTIFTFENVYKAYLDCRKRKKNTINALNFELRREHNIFDLVSELKERSYEVSRHICFVIQKPTLREIFAADFRDRVVHHLLYNELSPLFERDFIDRSYANRAGKGTHKAAYQVRRDLIDCPNGYALKLDIKSFFRSINKDILFSIVERTVVAERERERERFCGFVIRSFLMTRPRIMSCAGRRMSWILFHILNRSSVLKDKDCRLAI